MKTAGLRPRLRNDISSGNSQGGTSASAYRSKNNHPKKPTRPSFTSSPDSKLKPYAPSRISKTDFFFLNRADWGEKVGLMSLIGAEKQHTGLRQQIPQPLPYAESSSIPFFYQTKKWQSRNKYRSISHLAFNQFNLH